MEPESIAALVITALIAVAGFLMKQRANRWETRLLAVDGRLNQHDAELGEHNVHIAILKANVEHIRATGDETSKDVKELLKINGKRATG